MIEVSINITSVYEENGLPSDLFAFKFLSIAEAKQLPDFLEKDELFLAFINNKTVDSKYESINQSDLGNGSQRVAVKDGIWKSYVNLAIGDGAPTRKKFLDMIGYVAAHELLHQILYRNSHTSFHPTTYEDVGKNLNTSGDGIKRSQYHKDSNYRATARRILPHHRYRILKAYYRLKRG